MRARYRCLQLIVEMLNEQYIHGLMGVDDDAMVYELPDRHSSSNWAQCSLEQRPTFTPPLLRLLKPATS